MVAAPLKPLPVPPRLSQAPEGSTGRPSTVSTHPDASPPAGPRKKLSRASARLSSRTQYIASYYTKLPPKITVPRDPFQLRDVQPAISSPVRLQPRSWKPSLPYFSSSSAQMKPSNAAHDTGKSSGKSKFLGGWKPSLFSKAKSKPSLQISSGRENNTFDREPEQPTRLPPLLPSSPTNYTETTYPPESMIAESDVGTSVSRRPRNNRPVPPTPSLSRRTTPKKPHRRLPAPTSTAGMSWVTYGRFDTPAPPSTYNGDQSMYMSRQSFETADRSVFNAAPSGIGEITDTGDGLTSLASRPATPSVASPLRDDPSVPPTPAAPARPAGPSIVISGVPGEDNPETDLVESPSDMASHLEGIPERRSQDEQAESQRNDDVRSRRSSRPMTETNDPKLEKANTSAAGSRAGSRVSSQESATQTERGTVGDLTRSNTRISRSTAARRLSRASEAARVPRSRTVSPRESAKSPATATIQLPEELPGPRSRKQVFARRPTNRYSHKPFHYYNRYPERRLSQASRGKGNRISDNMSIGRMTSSTTNSSRTYISSRVGRLKRLWQDIVDMPWRGDSDYYGGTRGITATHHFRSSGGVGGGVSNRPKRDSRIPRAPWYRPKFQTDVMEHGAMMANYPAMRIPMGGSGPLTDGSERSVMERIALPASASPFISPFPMRSPYDTPESGPLGPRSIPSPLGNGFHGGNPPPSAFSPYAGGTKMPRTQLPGYIPSQRSPGSTPNGQMHPPSSFQDGYFSNVPPTMAPPPHRVPPVPSTAFESMYSIGGLTMHPPGQTPVWLPYPLPDNALNNIAAHTGFPDQQRQPRDRGVPVTIHATTTIHSAASSPRMRQNGPHQSVTTMGEYFPPGMEIGAAV